jgi:hypothetical protein
MPLHGYALEGRPLLGVTKVIHTVLRAPELESWFKRMGMQADAVRDEAAAFGKSVHAAMTAYLRGQSLVPLDMPEKWRLIVEAGRRWIDDNVEEVYAVEEPIASAIYGYAGEPDTYCRLVGRASPTVVDFKATGDLYWSHRAQTAAYRQAAKETYGDSRIERLVLRFDKDDPGRVHPHPLRQHSDDFALFGYLLGAYRIMGKGKA